VNQISRSVILAFSLSLVGIAGCAAPKPLPVPTPPKVAYGTLIVSEPDSLRCNISGKSSTPTTITTPRVVYISKIGAPATIRCFAPGYWTEQVTVLPGSKKPLLVRVLNGEQITPTNGPIRGRNFGPGGEFPRRINIRLRRDAFETATERDTYYAGQLRHAAELWASFVTAARLECESGAVSQKGRTPVSLPTTCREGLRRLVALEKGELQLIEQQRRRSRIP
jgi:hypothetical protein